MPPVRKKTKSTVKEKLIVNVDFVFKRETKGSVVYSEVNSEGKELKGDEAVVGQLYVRKAALPEGVAPSKISAALTLG